MAQIKKVGIVPTADLFYTDNVYDDKYHFANTYVIRATEAGMMPVGILSVNGRIQSDILDECDCFILCGGHHIWPYQIQVVDHAFRTGKKLLGICLGCQSIHSYFRTREEMEKRGYTGSCADLYEQLCEEKVQMLKSVTGHKSEILPRGNEDSVKHKVILQEGSRISRLLGGRTEIMGASLHIYAIDQPAPGEIVTGLSEDGVIEAIECGDNMIGTQFHPDVDSELHELFDFLRD